MRLRPGSPSRIDDAFGALAYAGPTKSPPLRASEPREWLGWADVRGATLDRWGTSRLRHPATTVLYGNQVNLLAGLTRKFTPRFSDRRRRRLRDVRLSLGRSCRAA